MCSEFKVGEQVVWSGMFGPMAGTVDYIGFTNYDIKRVDGGMCTVKQSRCRKAAWSDIEAACKVFANIGK